LHTVEFTFRALAEPEPGAVWERYFTESWPWYRQWYLQDGEQARPSYSECARMLRTHMPEFVPTWEQLVELAGGGDLEARLLSLWAPPPFLAACTQAVSAGAGGPTLVRNYDYSPSLLEGVVWRAGWAGRRVIGMGDCLWGLLDGMNDAGLAVSLTFGGRRVVGPGFGIPLLVRYLLETCETVDEARVAIGHVPVNLAHNLTLVDAAGSVVTAYLAPDRPPRFRDTPVATNHQGEVEWAEHATAVRTVEREEHVLALLAAGLSADELAAAFLEPPLYSDAYSQGFGTLYTAAYSPTARRVSYMWPGSPTWEKSFDAFPEDTRTQLLGEAAAA
jgi:predicted choloylglycine hydrolase